MSTKDEKTRQAVAFFTVNCGRVGDDAERSARRLATAETKARKRGIRFEWTRDPYGQEVHYDDVGKVLLPAMECTGYVDKVTKNGHMVARRDLTKRILASLSGISEDDDPVERASYRRIVEAELAVEALAVLAKTPSPV